MNDDEHCEPVGAPLPFPLPAQLVAVRPANRRPLVPAGLPLASTRIIAPGGTFAPRLTVRYSPLFEHCSCAVIFVVEYTGA